jgi:hypothetical protein
MATGWDGIVAQYERMLPLYYKWLQESADRSSSSQLQYFIDTTVGMLAVIPALRSDPFFEYFTPEPYTSHDCLTFRTVDWVKRVTVWCKVPHEIYGIQSVVLKNDEAQTTPTIDVNAAQLSGILKRFLENLKGETFKNPTIL